MQNKSVIYDVTCDTIGLCEIYNRVNGAIISTSLFTVAALRIYLKITSRSAELKLSFSR